MGVAHGMSSLSRKLTLFSLKLLLEVAGFVYPSASKICSTISESEDPLSLTFWISLATDNVTFLWVFTLVGGEAIISEFDIPSLRVWICDVSQPLIYSLLNYLILLTNNVHLLIIILIVIAYEKMFIAQN